ncbi:MAG: RdgB/HAM1 family non-canonical purine NTP pyrophosphatase [Thermoguttaceae bacterium]|nr:RdgB/HAM1 family non-canonical purine NTP pyrophosphatase [Thermoguttaceae bacterium]
MSVLVIGTNNRKKGKELGTLFAQSGWEIRTLADYPNAIEPEENGLSFAENAMLKASQHAKRLGVTVLADDSGLCVDVLNGAPGIYSARFAGEPTDNAANNALLLEKLRNIPAAQRTASFVCTMAVAGPDGSILAETKGVCHGRIRESLDGSGGFGYDPLFEIVEYHETFGQLPAVVKAVLSHRADAARQMLPLLQTLRTKTH